MTAATRPAAASVLPLVWVNGRRVEPGAPHLSVFDRGFTLADGLFETVRVYGGVPFRLDRHLARLVAGAGVLGIPVPHAVDAMVHRAVGVAHAAGASDLALRITLTRGAGAPGVAPPREAAPTIVIALQELPARAVPLLDAGLVAQIARARRNEHAASAGLKTLSYTDGVLALAAARAAGADDAIFLDTAGHVSEGTASNVLVRRGGELLTPPVSCGALPGITREAVLELAPHAGLSVAERPVTPDELLDADEVLLTSSLREIAPVVRIDGRAIGTGAVGDAAHRLAAAYAALVARERGP